MSSICTESSPRWKQQAILQSIVDCWQAQIDQPQAPFPPGLWTLFVGRKEQLLSSCTAHLVGIVACLLLAPEWSQPRGEGSREERASVWPQGCLGSPLGLSGQSLEHAPTWAKVPVSPEEAGLVMQ